jgi:hypothetical protein
VSPQLRDDFFDNRRIQHLFPGIRQFPPWFPFLQITPGFFLNARQVLMINPRKPIRAILAVLRIYPIPQEVSKGMK